MLAIVGLLEGNGVQVWLDGGWGVDALLGEQTRMHGDLDIAARHADVPKLRALLEARGYRDVPRDGTTGWNFVLGNEEGAEIDVHSFAFDSEGKHIYGTEYPADALTGTGSVGGVGVACISAEHMVRFHAGYELREIDIHDVQALHRRFGIPLLNEHEAWLKRHGRTLPPS